MARDALYPSRFGPVMKLSRAVCMPMMFVMMTTTATAAIFAQQQPTIAIRAVSAPSATSANVHSIDEFREIGAGNVLVNDGSSRTLVMFDGTLQHATLLADTSGTRTAYPQFGKLIPFAADSSLFYETDSRTLVVIDPQGRFGRVLSLPRPQDFNSMTSGGLVTTDNRGHLVYQGSRPFAMRPTCRPAGDVSPIRPTATAPKDSVLIFRADFETRAVDTVARSRTSVAGISMPATIADANCNVTGAKVRVDPSVPATDSWTVTSRGAIAIVRSHDYHIDWINADGTKRSTAKMPFDWRRLSDADKQAKIDSARRIIDSVTARGGYRLKSCAGGRSISFSTGVPQSADGGGETLVMGGRGDGSGASGASVNAAGGGSSGAGDPTARAPGDCQTVTVAAEFVPVDSMADYIAPIREGAALADLEGNVWILPTTSASAKGGLLYDVVNENGEIVERVQLPTGRTVAGFGRGGVLYLSFGDFKSGFVIEKVKVVR